MPHNGHDAGIKGLAVPFRCTSETAVDGRSEFRDRSKAVPAQDRGQLHAVAMGQPPTAKFLAVYDLNLMLICGLIKLADQWPSLGLRAVFAGATAFAAFQFARRRRRIRQYHLSQTLQLSGPEMRAIVKQSFYDFWRDLFFSLSSSGRRGDGQVTREMQGLEHIREALGKGRGVILWESSFFGRRVAAKRILKEHALSVSQIHDEYHMSGFSNSHSWICRHMIQPFFESREKPFVKEIIYLTRSDSLAFTRALAERLKQNGIICVSADGRAGHKFVPVDFLWRRDLFSTGIISLARLSGATLLPLFCVQEGDRTRLIIESPICVESDGDREGSVKRSILQYIGLLETYVTRYPEQYRRWSGRERVGYRRESAQ
jgi:lauroyl/myristoyl acyltransferase